MNTICHLVKFTIKLISLYVIIFTLSRQVQVCILYWTVMKYSDTHMNTMWGNQIDIMCIKMVPARMYGNIDECAETGISKYGYEVWRLCCVPIHKVDEVNMYREQAHNPMFYIVEYLAAFTHYRVIKYYFRFLLFCFYPMNCG